MAGIKKKSSLRDKSSKRSQSDRVSQFKQELANDNNKNVTPNSEITFSSSSSSSSYHENPFLRLAKSTKKEKQQVKSDKFVNRLIGDSTKISKSSLRRKKRKAREQLKPKLDDLLSNLPSTNNEKEEESNNNQVKEEGEKEDKNTHTKFITKISQNHIPNPTKASGIKQIMKQESITFTNALKTRDSNFSSLKSMIQQNLQK
ncbi:ribosome biogenesis protein SLX9 [Candida albicans P94015]|nr:ribosome biogenesis protein SLX9 [Candida albicans P94015]